MKQKKLRERLVLGTLVAVVVAGVGAYSYWKTEIDLHLRFRPWQQAEYQGLVDRLHAAAAAEDRDGVAACLDLQGARLGDEGDNKVHYGGGQGSGSISFEELAERGPFRVEKLEIFPFGRGALQIHVADKSEKQWEFAAWREPGQAPKITHIQSYDLPQQARDTEPGSEPNQPPADN